MIRHHRKALLAVAFAILILALSLGVFYLMEYVFGEVGPAILLLAAILSATYVFAFKWSKAEV